MKIRSNMMLKMAIAGMFSFVIAGLALASGHEREKKHEHEGCHAEPAAAVPTIEIISPADNTFTPLDVTPVAVNYTAPAGTIPLITLYRDGVAIDTFSIPAGSTAGTAFFLADISTVPPLGVTSFQAQICYNAASESDDDDHGDHHDRSVHSKKHSDSKRGKHRDQEDSDDDHDDDDGVSAPTCVLSNVVHVGRDLPPVFF